jgi:hypothetical protein
VTSAARGAIAAVSTPIRWRSNRAFSSDQIRATPQSWNASGSTATSAVTTQ